MSGRSLSQLVLNRLKKPVRIVVIDLVVAGKNA